MWWWDTVEVEQDVLSGSADWEVGFQAEWSYGWELRLRRGQWEI